MQKIELPRIAKIDSKLPFVIVGGFIIWGMYTLAQYVYIGEPYFFPMSEFESSIQFLPWTIWIYVALYPFNGGTFLIIKSEKTFNIIAYSFILLQMIAFFVFVTFPVAYHRELFPLPETKNLTIFVFEIIRTVDKPLNCFPSLHVANTFLMAYAFFLEQKKKLIPWLIMATLISLSTLTTKQHYIADVAFGVFLATALFIFFNKFCHIKDCRD